jgi:hypothetical protein
LDAELLNGDLHVFDILAHEGADVRDKTFTKRLEFMNKLIPKIKTTGLSLSSIRVKQFLDINAENLGQQISKLLKENTLPNDGFIFTPNRERYMGKVFKWKSVENLTVDYLVKVIKKEPTMTVVNMYVSQITSKISESELEQTKKLFGDSVIIDHNAPAIFRFKNSQVSITTEGIRVPSSINIEDKSIYEVSFNPQTVSFKVERIRNDKTQEFISTKRKFGNFWTVAEETFKTIYDPITLDMLLGKEKITTYFNKVSEGPGHLSQIKQFHNSVKWSLYDKYARNADYIMELAVGRFNDFNKWIKNGIKHVIAIDKDSNAIDQGLERIEEALKTSDIDIDAIAFDITKKPKGMITKHKMNAIFCNFAIHYLLDSEDTFKKHIANFVVPYSKTGTKYVVSFLDGQLLFDALKLEPSISMTHEGDLLFKISKKYKDTKFENTGQQIDVFIESIGTLSTEYLVNANFITKVLESSGFEIVESKYFKDIPKDKVKLNKAEQQYSDFHRFIVFQKK